MIRLTRLMVVILLQGLFPQRLRAEEILQPPPAQVPGPNIPQTQQELLPSAWDRDDWLVMHPKVALLTMQGYFRIRSGMTNRLDFDNGTFFETSNNGTPIARYPAYADNHANFSTTNMRLRLQPVLNLTENIHIVMTVDVLDNLILGQTPDTLIPGMSAPPFHALSKSQKQLYYRDNTLTNALAVKRAFLQLSALHEQLELQIGRVPDHFALGMLYNSGDGLDCDYGMVADRLSLSLRISEHIFTPIIQWQGRNLLFRPFGFFDPQPTVAAAWGDTMEYALRVRREDHPDDISQTLLHGGQVINYGLANAFRVQARDYPASVYNPPDTNLGFQVDLPPPPQTASERRDLFLYTGDAYLTYFWGTLELGIEAAVQAGHFTDSGTDVSNGSGIGPSIVAANPQRTDILMWGAAFEGKYGLSGDAKAWQFKLKSGIASGDSHSGIGALNFADTQRQSPNDHKLTNFQFSPDYHVDRLLYRTILGTVTDSFYFSPQVDYRFDPRFTGNVTLLYSQALLAASTPSALSEQPTTPLATEIDATLAFEPEILSNRGQITALLTGSLLFPLKGTQNDNSSQHFAWGLQGRLAAAF